MMVVVVMVMVVTIVVVVGVVDWITFHVPCGHALWYQLYKMLK